MARKSLSVSFKNAVIDYENMTITEINKDSEEEFDLREVLKGWNGVMGVSLTLKQDSSSIYTTYEDDTGGGE